MNGVNLEAFPFEYDLTWMSFFQDDSGRTYTRYGGRNDSGPETHLNQESLVHTMREVLKLHRDRAVQQESKFEPIAKRVRLPADIPPMKAMLSKRDESCIHCHDVKVARLRHLQDQGQLKKEMVFTYPSPQQLGFSVDAKQHNLIDSVKADSPASAAGLEVGDRLAESDGQRILTYADLTRVLELAPERGSLPVVITRDGRRVEKSIELTKGWRISQDPSWRASLHVLGPGAGFWGRPANKSERKTLELGANELALKVTFIWAPHAKASPVKIGDVIVDLDGNRANMNMRQFHGFLQLHREWGDSIKLKALRNGKPITFEMQLPTGPSE